VSRYSTRDEILLLGLIPLVVFFVGVHVRQVMRTGLALPPVFATPPGDDGYPRVGGRPLEVETAGSGLQAGDRLLRIGDADLRGAGFAGFMGIALEQAGRSLHAPLVFERDGVVREVELAMRPMTLPWLRVPFLAGMALTALLVLLRRPRNGLIQRGALAIGGVVICEAIFMGGPRWQTEAALAVFFFGPVLFFSLIVLWLGEFPGRDSLTRQLPGLRLLAWSTGALWILPKLSYFFGGPIPSARIPVVDSGCEAIGVLAFTVPITWNYFHTDAIGRRQIRWVAYGLWTAGIAMVPVLAAPIFVPEWRWFQPLLGAAGVMGAAVPLGFLIAIVAYNLFDIDRLLSAVASYTLLLVVLLAAAFVLVPRVAALVAASAGLGVESTRLGLSVLLAALVVPVNRRLRPRLDHAFFPEREALERGVTALLEELARTADERGLLEVATQGLYELFRAERAAGYELEGDGYAAVAARGTALEVLPRLDVDHPLVSVLGQRESPLVVSANPAGGSRQADPALGGKFLSELATPLLLPIWRGATLAAFIALGTKRSGDVYTTSDLALLSAVIGAASRQVDRLGALEELTRERDRRSQEASRRRAAESAHFARSRHLAAVSHDLRQPLHALGLFADALERRVGDHETRAIVGRMRNSVRALREMFDSLIDLSRLEQDAVRPAPSEVDLDLLLERLADEAEPAAREKGLALRRCPTGLRVRSDAVLLGRILQNLLANAVRYTQEGWIELRAQRGDGRVRVTVADTGLGIPPDRREAIFEEFVRLENGASVQGLGLGLAIVDRLARLLGHPVAVESEPGRGSAFSIDVPEAQPRLRALPLEARAPTRAGSGESPSAPLLGRRLLVVDDDLDVLLAMRELLEQWGAEVALAASPEEALERLETLDAPEAVIADYRLGDALGTQVVEAIRQRLGRAVPALVITGSRSTALEADLARHGLPHLTKPVGPARLRAALSELLRGVV
jgi:signal transduction histidine kinase